MNNVLAFFLSRYSFPAKTSSLGSASLLESQNMRATVDF